jgi:LacI family transcriptional regulator
MGVNKPKDITVIAFTDGIISKYSTLLLQPWVKVVKKMETKQQNADWHETEDEHLEEENYKLVIETHLIERNLPTKLEFRYFPYFIHYNLRKVAFIRIEK